MSADIQVKISMQSAEALQKLKEFVAQADSGLKLVVKPQQDLVNGANSWLNVLTKNRMALMELGHSARATADIMIMGGSPRMLAAELPRVIQGLATMGIGMSSLIPIIGGVTLAAVAGYGAWKVYNEIINQVAEDAKKMAKEMTDVIGAMEVMQKLGNAGVISNAERTAYMKLLHPTSQRTSAEIIAAGGQNITFDQIDPKAVEQIEKDLIKKGLMVPGENKGDRAKISPLGQALAGISGIERTVSTAGDTGEEKAIDSVAARYQKLRDAAMVYGITAIQGSKMSQQGLDDLIGTINKAENAELTRVDTEARFKQQKQQSLAAEKAYNDGVQMYAKEASERRGLLTRKMEIDDLTSGKDRMSQIEEEFTQRTDLERSMLLEGITTEDEYTKAVEDASIRRMKAIKTETDTVAHMLENRRTAELHEIKQNEATKLRIQQDTTGAAASLLGSAAEAAKAFGREGFAAWKALAIAQAVVSGANAVLLQLGQGDAYSAPWRAAAAAAAAGIQIAMVASAQPAGYAEGGVIFGQGSGTSDSVPIMASRGEFMVKEQSARGSYDFLNDFNKLGMGAVDMWSHPTSAPSSSVSSVAGGAPSLNISVHNWNDAAAMTKHIKDNPEVHHIILDKVRKVGYQRT